jgi:Na+-driven multidrug efflux pump
VWWAITGSMMVQAAIVVSLFKRGSWREKAI